MSVHEFSPSEAKSPTPRSSRASVGLPATAARPMFTLVHFAEGGWEYNPKLDTFIARPAEIYHVPGVGGVSEEGDTSSQLAEVRGRGGVVIEPSDRRLGRFKDYVAGYPCDGGAMCWTFRQSKGPIRTGRGSVVWPKTEDWNEFCLHIVEAGIVERMAPWVWTQMEARAVSVLGQKQQQAMRNAASAPAAEAARARLEKMRAAWARYSGATVAEVEAEGEEIAPVNAQAEITPSTGKKVVR